MATEQAYLDKAKSNQRFLDTISDEFPDWLATVAFYKAVHLVEAVFARAERPSKNHSDRNYRLKRKYKSIWMAFHPLYNSSKVARYTGNRLDPKDVRGVLIAVRLADVEELVQVELARPSN